MSGQPERQEATVSSRPTVRIERRGAVQKLTPRFSSFLREALSGTSLDDIQDPEQLRADYQCLRGLLAVEVKTLEGDPSERLNNVTNELRQRDDWPVFYGKWPMESVIRNLHDSENVKLRLLERLGRAIRTHLEKANEQLAAYTVAFPRTRVVRVVAILNEDHQAYDPAVVTRIVQHELSRDKDRKAKYDNIDAVIFLTERHAAAKTGSVLFPFVTIGGRPLDTECWKSGVLEYVAARWAAWAGLQQVHDKTGIESFGTIEHVPNEMKRHELWRLRYRRRPYMRMWSEEQLRDRWDEIIVIGMLGFVIDSPYKPSDAVIKKMLEQTTHVTEEMAHRGIPISRFKAEIERMVAAAIRMRAPSDVVLWIRRELDRNIGDQK